MALFGDKHRMESLMSELTNVKALLEKETSAKATLVRELDAAQQERMRVQEQLAEYEQRISALARPRWSPPDERGAPPLAG